MKTLKIALLGYGKMGKEIEAIAISKGHQITAKIDTEEGWILQSDQLKISDIAIDFSVPNSAMTNINNCFQFKLPLVIGTTGWHNQLESVKLECEKIGGSLLWASNFSVGMNVFFKINTLLANLMSKFPEYKAQVHEIHHTQKLDAPSGTAISIANGVLDQNSKLESWKLIENSIENQDSVLPITYERIEKVPGTHMVKYNSKIDEIEIKHEAKSRKGFAMGAILAAEWLFDKKGFYNMADVLS